jgi:hypothetical protein
MTSRGSARVLLLRRRRLAPPEPDAGVAAAADRVFDTVERLLEEYRLPTNGAAKRRSRRLRRVLAHIRFSHRAPYRQIRQAIVYGTFVVMGTLVVLAVVVYAL